MERIGRYEITGELGRGAMGVVYRAKDPAIGRTVAIKTIRLGDITDPDEQKKMRDRLMREARSAGVLSHPNIVTIYDIGEEGTMAYIAMEYVSGSSLEQLIRREGALDGAQILRTLRETAAALDYAHEQGIIHRDIKPGNIMINEAGASKITDFGVAKITSQNMTQADMVLGTPNYMPPEQVEAKGVDGRADQFSLAVIAYELLTGEKPFGGETLAGLLFQIVKREPSPAHQLNATLGEAASSAIAQAMRKDPKERFAKCSAFVRALESGLSASPGWKPLPRGAASEQVTVVASASAISAPAASAPVLPPPRRRGRDLDEPRRKWPWAAAAVVALAAIAGGAGWYLNEPEHHAVMTETPQPVAVGKPSPMPAVPPPAEEPKPVAQTIEPPKEETPAPPGVTPAAVTPAKEEPPPVSGSAAFEILTSPGGATVSIDAGKTSCVTPCVVTLGYGRHTLTFFLANYRPTTRLVDVPQSTSVNVVLQRSEGTIMIRTNPPGASILINGTARTERTPAVLTLTSGKYKVTLRREGAADYEETIEVKDQVITNINVNW
jgi:serine/threonine-protein kinase